MFAQNRQLTDFLPEAPENWHLSGTQKIIDVEALYDYINGGAELYISYSFQSVMSAVYTHKSLGEIRVEIFDMGLPKNAFGVFSHTRTKDEGEFGNGSQYFTGAQIFWKGPFYITVIADDGNEEIKNTIKNISQQIDKKINVQGQKPSVVSRLPAEDLVEDGYLYFHHYIWLNSYYFISTENILKLDEQTDAVLAKYAATANRMYLLLIEYPSSQMAAEATELFSLKYMGRTAEKQTRKIEDGTFVAHSCKNQYFIAVFNAATALDAEELIKKTEAGIPM
ncbi:MAG: hypothetical protein JXB34_11205 [Bacteroidales bacterium]|nr:hypothetical protein [Bacteroidales bacterium]